MGQNQSWLAKQLVVTRQCIYLYNKSKSIPKGKKLDKLLKVLNLNNKIKPRSLDNL